MPRATAVTVIVIIIARAASAAAAIAIVANIAASMSAKAECAGGEQDPQTGKKLTLDLNENLALKENS